MKSLELSGNPLDFSSLPQLLLPAQVGHARNVVPRIFIEKAQLRVSSQPCCFAGKRNTGNLRLRVLHLFYIATQLFVSLISDISDRGVISKRFWISGESRLRLGWRSTRCGTVLHGTFLAITLYSDPPRNASVVRCYINRYCFVHEVRSSGEQKMSKIRLVNEALKRRQEAAGEASTSHNTTLPPGIETEALHKKSKELAWKSMLQKQNTYSIGTKKFDNPWMWRFRL